MEVSPLSEYKGSAGRIPASTSSTLMGEWSYYMIVIFSSNCPSFLKIKFVLANNESYYFVGLGGANIISAQWPLVGFVHY